MNGQFQIARWLFLRLLGLVYLIAFISLWTQVHGLIGSDGLLPIAEHLDWARANLGGEAHRRLPTLCWIDSSDGFLDVQCGAGVALSVALIIGLAPLAVLPLLWLLYLSLSVAGQTFTAFQWDTLLLETGFMAMFVAPLAWRPRVFETRPPPRAGIVLLWFLLFKLMFLSGVTKLLSGDPTWRDLSALGVHFETQPLPSWIGYWAHQLPDWVQRCSCAIMYVIEIGLPLMIFGPRRVRHLAAAGLVLLQILIVMTGSYGFFNLLAMVLCVPLLDDGLLRPLLPAPLARRVPATPAPPRPRAATWGLRGVTAILLTLSGLTMVREMVRTMRRGAVPGAVTALLRPIEPLRTINGYGLFRVMTTERPEIVVEGSADGITWREYGFRWKPGDTKRRPRYPAPHQPRLDWQMWFAALYPPRQAAWLQRLLAGLVEGEPSITSLMGDNPFPDAPPRHARLVLYRYRFTKPQVLLETGEWWQREQVGILARPVTRSSSP